MKRIYISLLTLIFVAIQAIAAPVDPEKALEIANSFWANKVSLKKTGTTTITTKSIRR